MTRDGLIKEGNIKLTISINQQTRDTLTMLAGSQRKIGQLIDDLIKEKYLSTPAETNIQQTPTCK